MTTINKMLISFTAGAILGILYAPAKGSRTRRKIAGIGDDLKQGWNNITDSIAGRIENIKEGVDGIADRAIEKVEDTQFEVRDRGGFL